MEIYIKPAATIDDYSGFSHVLDSLNVVAQLPFQLIPDHWFRRAEPQEVERIKKELTVHPEADLAYEYTFTKSKDGRIQGHQMQPAQWRYYVISYSPDKHKMTDIEYAADLLKNDITLGYSFSKSGILYNPFQISTFFHDPAQLIPEHQFYDPTEKTPRAITDEDLAQITATYGLITDLDKTLYPNVSRAFADFHQTKAISKTVTLKVLSYFSIIECLLTHPPRPDDRTDSITRQITSKMCLLSKRFQRELQYDSFFPNIIEPEKVWNRLYSYRSLLAHGGDIDFQQKFSILISTDNIRSFLVETIKLLILYALKEPEFLADLQKC